jgi:hypothetical protein
MMQPLYLLTLYAIHAALTQHHNTHIISTLRRNSWVADFPAQGTILQRPHDAYLPLEMRQGTREGCMEVADRGVDIDL